MRKGNNTKKKHQIQLVHGDISLFFYWKIFKINKNGTAVYKSQNAYSQQKYCTPPPLVTSSVLLENHCDNSAGAGGHTHIYTHTHSHTSLVWKQDHLGVILKSRLIKYIICVSSSEGEQNMPVLDTYLEKCCGGVFMRALHTLKTYSILLYK